LNLSHLEPIDCPLPNLQIFLACVISGIDLIFHSFYRIVVLMTSWDRGGVIASNKTHPLLEHQAEAEDYLKEREAEAEVIRQEIENQPGQAAFRETMRQRREQRLMSDML
jgi:hypothetical protein